MYSSTTNKQCRILVSVSFESRNFCINILIVMINICRKRILATLLNSQAVRPSSSPALAFRPKYNFASKGFGNFFGGSFVKDLKKQIEFLQGQMEKVDNTDNEQYFLEQGWKIRYIPEKTLFQFNKNTGNREVKVFCGVTGDPPNEANQEIKEEEEKEKKKLKYMRAVVWLRMLKSKRWVVAEIGIAEGSVELTTMFSSSLTPGIDFPSEMYNGPDVQTLPSEILQAVSNLLSEVGLKTEMIMNMVIHASNKADEIDLKWMQDLRDIIDE